MTEPAYRPSEKLILILKALDLWEQGQFRCNWRTVRASPGKDSDVGEGPQDLLAKHIAPPLVIQSVLQPPIPGFLIRATVLALAHAIEPPNTESGLPELARRGLVQAEDAETWTLPFEISWTMPNGRAVRVRGRPYDVEWAGVEILVVVDDQPLFTEPISVVCCADDLSEFTPFAWTLCDKGRFWARAACQPSDESASAVTYVAEPPLAASQRPQPQRPNNDRDGDPSERRKRVLSLDETKQILRIDGGEVRFGGYQAFDALNRLLQNNPEPIELSRSEIDVLRKKLRSKIPWLNACIENQRGIGYRLKLPTEIVFRPTP